jgi:hypothetical protein
MTYSDRRGFGIRSHIREATVSVWDEVVCPVHPSLSTCSANQTVTDGDIERVATPRACICRIFSCTGELRVALTGGVVERIVSIPDVFEILRNPSFSFR